MGTISMVLGPSGEPLTRLKIPFPQSHGSHSGGTCFKGGKGGVADVETAPMARFQACRKQHSHLRQLECKARRRQEETRKALLEAARKKTGKPGETELTARVHWGCHELLLQGLLPKASWGKVSSLAWAIPRNRTVTCPRCVRGKRDVAYLRIGRDVWY